MTWDDILKIGLSAGVISAVLNIAFGWIPAWIKEKAQSNRAATYSAIRVAVILEEFSFRCAQQISESAAEQDTAGQMGTTYTTLPSLGEYPSDVDWKSLDAKLAACALALRNEASLSNGTIAAMADIDLFQVSDEFEAQAGKCGYRAWEIATAFRNKYDLPKVEPDRTHWDAIGLLKTRHDKALNYVP